jgi:hypothetical protein
VKRSPQLRNSMYIGRRVATLAMRWNCSQPDVPYSNLHDCNKTQRTSATSALAFTCIVHRVGEVLGLLQLPGEALVPCQILNLSINVHGSYMDAGKVSQRERYWLELLLHFRR